MKYDGPQSEAIVIPYQILTWAILGMLFARRESDRFQFVFTRSHPIGTADGPKNGLKEIQVPLEGAPVRRFTRRVRHEGHSAGTGETHVA